MRRPRDWCRRWARTRWRFPDPAGRTPHGAGADRVDRFGLTRRARALHFRHGGDHYLLRAVNRKQFVLVRRADDEDPGVSLTAKLSGIGGGKRLVVRAVGRAVAADIVLVTLFAGVDRAPLTRSGAVRAALGRSTRLFAESQA
ncbi:hypothetical protein [Streptomyces anulatus]|uniref:hypothetical protein n=1 Tax=Streptomyces anulatus TaxID=1892 RepID=UPI00269AAA82